MFEEGIINSGSYATPYGTTNISVKPAKVEVDLTEDGGKINLEYELQIGEEKNQRQPAFD